MKRTQKPSNSHVVTEQTTTIKPVDMSMSIDKFKHVAFESMVFLIMGCVLGVLLLFLAPGLPEVAYLLPLLIGLWPVIEEFLHSRKLKGSRNKIEQAKAHAELIVAQRAYSAILDLDGDGTVSREEQVAYERDYLVYFVRRLVDMNEKTTKRTWCDPKKDGGNYGWSPDMWEKVRQDCVDAGILFYRGAERQRAYLYKHIKTVNMAITLLDNANKLQETHPKDYLTRIGPSSKNQTNAVATDQRVEQVTTLPVDHPDFEMTEATWSGD